MTIAVALYALGAGLAAGLPVGAAVALYNGWKA
jgi:hypothetical protein